jgi:hypothetical protein
MGKEVGTANEMVASDISGGFYSIKEAVYNFLGNFFNWLSTHQGLALIIVLIVLIIIFWLIIRTRKYGKQLEEKVSSNKVEVGKKDALIEEQKNKLAVLHKELSDQKKVVSEALLGTLMTLTGYDISQLQIFFKFLTEISGNPLQTVDTQSYTAPKSQERKKESDVSPEEKDAKA